MNMAVVRKSMEQAYSEADLLILCADLKVDYESLSGHNKSLKIIALIQHFERRGRLDELEAYCLKERPNVEWQEVFGATTLELDTTEAHADLAKLSSQQKLMLLQIAESEDGIYVSDLAGALGLSRGEVVYRARDLSTLGLIEIEHLTDYRYKVADMLKKSLATADLVDLLKTNLDLKERLTLRVSFLRRLLRSIGILKW